MPTNSMTLEELADKAERIYQERLRKTLMPQHKGKFLTIDVDSGDYELADDDLAGEVRLRERSSHGNLFLMRVGYTSAYSLAGGLEEDAA